MYNDATKRTTYNIYHFSRTEPEFQSFDITPCFTEEHKMHITIAMTWDMAMDIFGTISSFNKRARKAVVKVGHVTPIRVQNIEVRGLL